MAEIELISKEEQEFIRQYFSTLKSFQDKNSEQVVYTKIPMSYAILNKLSLKNIVFHPISIGYAEQMGSKIMDLDVIKKTIQDIIEYELYTDENVLTAAELQLLIKHFQTL